MNPGTVTAIAYLIAEAVAAGVSIAALLREAEQTGRVTPERWAEVIREVRAADAQWRSGA